jgi:hypothetical protein
MSHNRYRWAAAAALGSILSIVLVTTRCADSTAPTKVVGTTETSTGGPMQTPGGGPMATVAMGSVSTLLGRANFAGVPHKFFPPFFSVSRTTGDWHTLVWAQPNLDMAVQDIVFQPGGSSGWHRHPGPVFIQVVKGTMTFYEAGDSHCTPIVRTVGQGYLDDGLGHIARNESTTDVAENIVVYLAPQGAALRIDVTPAPGNCPF